MIVSRKQVIWGGVIIVILFAIINRIRLYMNSEIVLGHVEYNSNLVFQYKGNTYIYDYESSTETISPIKLLIPFDSPIDFVIFDFPHFLLWVILIVIFISGGWILFLQSFYPKRDKFFLFKTKKEPDEKA